MGVSDMKLTIDQINKIPDVQARERLKADILQGYENQKAEAARNDFLTFVKRMWPQFIEGQHHKVTVLHGASALVL
jgi:hypothetical protein